MQTTSSILHNCNITTDTRLIHRGKKLGAHGINKPGQASLETGSGAGQHNTVWKLVPAIDNTMVKQVSISNGTAHC